MAAAIRHIGLEPYLINVKEFNFLNALYAYLKEGIPVILGFNLLKNNQVIGKHAVTIVGMNLENTYAVNNDGFQLKSAALSKIYVHDDQIGPFTRMNINREANTLTVDMKLGTNDVELTAHPELILIPLYHKIRIPYEQIVKIVNQLNLIIQRICKIQNIDLAIIWDIYLITNNKYKTELKKIVFDDLNEKNMILEKVLPKYIWRAEVNLNGDKIDFLFDATDIEQGEIFIQAVYFNNFLKEFFMHLKNGINKQKLSQPLFEIFTKI